MIHAAACHSVLLRAVYFRFTLHLQLGASLSVVVKLLCRLLLTSPYLFTSVVREDER